MKPLTRCLVALLICSGVAAADDWPTFRGNAMLQGRAEALSTDLQPLWLFEVEEGIEGGAAIVDGVVYVGALDGKLYAVKLADGKQLWSYEASDEIRASVSVHDGVVYVGDAAGLFHAVDAKSGKAKWSFKSDSEIVSSANFYKDWLLFGSNDQFLYALKTDGSLAWKIETDGYVYATPAIVDGKAYSAGCDGFIREIDIATGTENKRIEIGAYVGASPAIRDGKAYVGTFENQVLGIDLKLDKVIWSYENPERQFPYISSAALAEDRLIVGGRDKTVHALSLSDGKELWSHRTRAKVDSSPVLSGKHAFVGSLTGELFAFEIATGKIAWKFDAGSGVMATPAIADGRLVVGTVDGQLYCFGNKGATP